MSNKTKSILLRVTPELNSRIHKAYIRFLQVNSLEDSDKIVSKSEFIRVIIEKCTDPEFKIIANKSELEE